MQQNISSAKLVYTYQNQIINEFIIFEHKCLIQIDLQK